MLAAALLLGACGGGNGGDDGPLDGLDGMGTGTVDYAVGDTFATGLGVVLNPTDDTIVIDAVRPVPGDGSLRYLGAKVAGYDRTIGNTDLTAWPVTGDEFGPLEDAEGYRLGPGSEAATRGFELRVCPRVGHYRRASVFESTGLHSPFHSSANVHVVQFGDGGVFPAVRHVIHTNLKVNSEPGIDAE